MAARKFLCVAAIAIPVIATFQAVNAGPFACEQAYIFTKSWQAFSKANTGSISSKVLIHHTDLWVTQTGKQRCNDHAAEKSVKLGCLNKELDYDAILSAVPEGLLASTKRAQSDYFAKVRKAEIVRKAGIKMNNACIRAGLQKGKIREIK